jgi:hypothetical protein
MKVGDLVKDKAPWWKYRAPRVGLVISRHHHAVKVLVDGKVITSLTNHWEVMELVR